MQLPPPRANSRFANLGVAAFMIVGGFVQFFDKAGHIITGIYVLLFALGMLSLLPLCCDLAATFYMISIN